MKNNPCNSTTDDPNTTTTEVLMRTRKRKLNIHSWKRNVRKSANLNGKCHNNCANKWKKEKNPRYLKESHKTCRFKCEDQFDDTKRKTTWEEYWALQEYLEPCLNITKMHNLYLEWLNDKSVPGYVEGYVEGYAGVNCQMYRRIFCDNFNLSFYTPKKDNCSTCQS